MGPAKLQPALIGGVAIGVLSSLPLVQIGNFCCCAWVVAGGLLAAYVMQQNHPAPVNAGDGALVGLMAGAIGAVVGSVLSLAIGAALGPLQAQLMERLLQGAQNMPPEAREALEQWRTTGAGGAVSVLGFLFFLALSLFVFSGFGLIGGLLGALFFKKDTPPPPPPPSGWQPPTFAPPPSPPPLPPTAS
jgi:hypothetical protein